jgi:hypothetical protein
MGNIQLVSASLLLRQPGIVGQVLTVIGPDDIDFAPAPGGIAGVGIQNSTVPLAGFPFTTINVTGGGIVATNSGGGVVTLTVVPSAPGVTGGGTPGTLPIWSAATVLADSALADSGTTFILTGRNFAPDADNAHEVGARNRNWSTVWARRIGSDDTLILESGDFGGNVGGIVESGGFPQLAWADQTTDATGVEIVSGPFAVDVPIFVRNQVSGAAASVGTLTNAPAAGDPPFWLPIKINGVQYWLPAWHA